MRYGAALSTQCHHVGPVVDIVYISDRDSHGIRVVDRAHVCNLCSLQVRALAKIWRKKIAYTFTSISGAEVSSQKIAVVDVVHADVHDDSIVTWEKAEGWGQTI